MPGQFGNIQLGRRKALEAVHVSLDDIIRVREMIAVGRWGHQSKEHTREKELWWWEQQQQLGQIDQKAEEPEGFGQQNGVPEERGLSRRVPSLSALALRHM